VNVIGAFYPNRVAVTGVGAAILGKEMNVGIDTRKAGPGGYNLLYFFSRTNRQNPLNVLAFQVNH
jgi:hypothetical protein